MNNVGLTYIFQPRRNKKKKKHENVNQISLTISIIEYVTPEENLTFNKREQSKKRRNINKKHSLHYLSTNVGVLKVLHSIKLSGFYGNIPGRIYPNSGFLCFFFLIHFLLGKKKKQTKKKNCYCFPFPPFVAVLVLFIFLVIRSVLQN